MTQKESELIALFDMDGTLCNFNKSLLRELNSIRSNYEPEVLEKDLNPMSDFLSKRTDMILKHQFFWENLEKFQLGWDILSITLDLRYRNSILTQAPKNKPYALAGKLVWMQKNPPLGEMDYTMTRDKGLVYGTALIDDYPGYIARWLKWRKNGLVIMPANEGNKNYFHPNVIRYDGTNLSEVRRALGIAKKRKAGEQLNL